MVSGKLLLALDSTVILRFRLRGTHDRIFSVSSLCFFRDGETDHECSYKGLREEMFV
jgi:hypothetical protein